MTRARNTKAPASPGPASTIRCAIYTRKSSEEGLALEFNSLDAQRESAEAYIASQKSAGWTALPERYDDGGFTGGNMERPALARLLADIEAKKVDCVLVYKVDRLSRSLFDFGKIMETFDRHGVSFVSVTQHFNTANSMGRLTLNILLSFAQFEREVIGERIRDKLAAQRRKGKWAGGVPVLGYDVERSGPSPHLVINATEAAQVRDIFALYLDRGSLLPVVHELADREWTSKKRITTKGETVGGKPFDRTTLYALLTNPVYIGKVVHKAETFDGEHPPIVSPELFDRVRKTLESHGRTGSSDARNQYGALLRRLLYCKACGCAMVHNFTTKRGTKNTQYRYYTCSGAMKNGRKTCPVGSLSAPEIERAVVDEVRSIAGDKTLLKQITAESLQIGNGEIESLATEQDDLRREMARHHAELKKLVRGDITRAGSAARTATLNDELRRCEQRASKLANQIENLRSQQIDGSQITRALAQFESSWDQLAPRQQSKVLALLVDRVEYDADEGTITMKFHESGLEASAAPQTENAA